MLLVSALGQETDQKLSELTATRRQLSLSLSFTLSPLGAKKPVHNMGTCFE